MSSDQKTGTGPEQTPLEKAASGLALRSVGPAFMGGRIADIAVDPRRKSTWYVAVGSGGVWKTVNAGTTWEAVFEDQPSYSIGCVALDPRHPDVVWVGTGEAVSGRHVAWGDGVYRSLNGGQSWTRMGLDHSEHIADILIDPHDSNVVYVAAEGPLWSAGGQRGVYKTADGGKTWDSVLSIDDNTGVTSIAFAPDDPDVIYAASYQRRRHVSSFLGGGPGSGLHKSSDGGATWRPLTQGLPEGDMGKIGIAVTPADPDLVYATIEADKAERGFYRSTDRGESWEKRNEYISGGTGPHYYQEITASPIDPERVYQVDVFVHVTRDGGKSFTNLETGKTKHSDNHAIWIDPDDGHHLLVGTDAGLYESFDEGGSWRHFPNLPISQFYRVAIDNSEPFYNILGGAQDLGTLFGPSRTLNIDGVRNQDWSVPLGADGYHVAFDPNDPEMAYLEWQEGNVMRWDRRTMELQDIQPQPGPGDPPERWNWDCPILVSPHASNRIYVASQRLWRSDDRGDSWTPISGDLTHNRNRYEQPIFDRVQSVDSLYDHMAMSLYATITHVTESPVTAGVIYVGTDDGLIQVTEDGGTTWRQGGDLPELADDAFVNDVEASQHDADTVFAAADRHKNGDYSPYVFRSDDRGRSWHSIRGDLPDGTVVWAIEQDHVNSELLFLGTEYGIYASLNGGQNWHRFSKDAPTIAFREIKLHRRDDDLVGASFGRGFYILDDYSPLRSLAPEALTEPATLFPVRDAWWYVPYQPMQAPGQPTLGSTAFRRPNPEFGATFTYHLAADLQSSKKRRQETEKQQRDDGVDRAFPGWDSLWAEHVETDPTVVLIIRDEAGEAIRHLEGATSAGLHRTTWDLRLPAPLPVSLKKPDFEPPWYSPPRGALTPPGDYSVELATVTPAGLASVSGPETFTVKATPATAVQTTIPTTLAAAAPTADPSGTAQFQRATSDLARQVYGAANHIERGQDRIRHLRAALLGTPPGDPGLHTRLETLHRRLEELNRRLGGDQVRERLHEAAEPSIRALVGRVMGHHWDTTQPPTQTQRSSVARAATAFEPLQAELSSLIDGDLAQLVADVDAAGGPWTPR